MIVTITKAISSQLQDAGINFTFPWYYPSIGEYASLMEAAGFRVTLAHHFDRPTLLDGENGLKNWINMFASSFFEGNTPGKKNVIIEKVEQQLKTEIFIEGKWIADYKRLRVIGVK